MLQKLFLTVVLFSLGLLAGCPNPASNSNTSSSSVTFTMNGSVAQVQKAASAAGSPQQVAVSLALGSSSHKVYFVFTNESTASSSSSMPTVVGDVGSGPTGKAASLAPASEQTAPMTKTLAQGAPSDILETNRTILQKVSASAAGSRAISSLTPSFDSAPTAMTLGASGNYIPYGGTSAIPCTLRYVVDQSTGTTKRKLFVWVANSCFDTTATSGNYTYTTQLGTSSIPFKVNSAQVKAIGDAFLDPAGTGNDIYDYDTAIYGKEYPDAGAASPGSGLITPQGEIHIYLVDLNSTSTTKGNGGTMGYFYGGDNIQTGQGVTDTNQKIMFQLDAEMLGNPTIDGSMPTSTGSNQSSPPWSLTTSYWPNQLLATLAHEFQHMIQFYQKQVKNNVTTGTVTWVNEMASMVTEDFVAAKIPTLGPRGAQFNADGTFSYTFGTGALYSIGTTSAYNDYGSRLAFFNYYYPTVGLQTWNDPTTGALANYGVAYAFGAWLARNYGGPELFHRIVTNANTDETAVTSAVNALNGTTYTMPDLLEQWAAAMLLGPYGNGPSPYSLISNNSWTYSPTSVQYGSGVAQSFTYGSIDPSLYRAYNYVLNKVGQTGGPRVFTTTTGVSSIPARAFYYYTPDGGGASSGTKSYTVTVPANVNFQIVTVPTP